MSSKKRPTHAFVLAAGLGERMRPLTERVPKPLIRLAGKPLIDHVLDRLVEAGITHVVVNVHYLADRIEKHLARRKLPKIAISDERDQLLDTGGGVYRALAKLGRKPFLIHNSDTVWIEGLGHNLNSLIESWDDDKMDSLMLLAPVAASIGYDGPGDFHMDAVGRLRRQSGAPIAPFVFAGVSIAHPRLFVDAPEGPFSMNRLWDDALAAGRLYGIRLEGIWMHVGTPDALSKAEAAIVEAQPANSGSG